MVSYSTTTMPLRHQLIILIILMVCVCYAAGANNQLKWMPTAWSTRNPDIVMEESGPVDVKPCPRTCTCMLEGMKRLSVSYCTMDPLLQLPKLFHKYPNISEIVACNVRLSKIPKAISILTKLQTIKMNQNTIDYIPEEVFGLSKLLLLELTHNKISKIPEAIGNLTNLKEIVLGFNQIHSIPAILSKLNIVYLDLSRNKLDGIPDVTFNMKQLRKLYLQSNSISDVAKEISNLSFLQKINLDDNKIELLPESFSDLTKLTDLKLAKNQIQKNIPEVIYRLPKLQYLDLSSNNITTLPAKIGNITTLHYLIVSHNAIPTIPAEICQLFHLFKLDLSFNKIQEVPVEVSLLSYLEKLYLENNKIKTIPMELSKVSKLQILNINQNYVVSIPSEIFKLTKLKQVSLGHNKIRSIPRGISSLVHLENLDLSNNELQTVPSDIFNLTSQKLLQIRLDNNKISKLSGNASEVTFLRKLDLSWNHLRKMPHQICQLTHLEELRLSHNKIQTMPCQLSRTLTLLDMSYNNVQNVSCSQLSKLPFIRHLYLDHNNIRQVKCNLTTFTYLAILHLYNNKIATMPCKQLSGSQSLSDIRMSHNSIIEIPDNCLHTLPILMYLDLSYNKIEMLPKSAFDYISTVKMIYLRNNNIHTVEPGLFHRCFNSLKVVDLSYNKISSMDSWPLEVSTHRSGFIVDLSNNRLTNFTHIDGPFTSGKNDTRFKFQNNSISHFMDVFKGWNIQVNSSEDFDYLLNRTDFYLAGNPLMCDCEDYDVYRYMQQSGKTSYNNLRCGEPLSLRGQNPANIPLTDFVCNVTEDCPLGCHCIDMPHSQTMQVTCENYTGAGLPNVLPTITRQGSSYHLDLDHRNLDRISLRPYLPQVTNAILSNNSITEVSMKVFTSLRNIKVLYLDNNNLRRLPDSIDYLNNGTVHDVRLGNNPWVCDCKASKLITWIQANEDIISDTESIVCSAPHNMKGVKVTAIKPLSMLCAGQNMAAIYVLVPIAAVVFLAFLGAGLQDHIRYAHWRLFGRDECDGEGKEFDVFVTYASEDETYILDYLIPQLEIRGYKVCFHLVHFHGGKPIHINIYECIEKSKRTLAFFSNHFYESNFSIFEFHMALDLDIRNKTRRLITIKDTDLDMDGFDISIKSYFKTHSYIRKDDDNFWKNLEYTLPRNKLGVVGLRRN